MRPSPPKYVQRIIISGHEYFYFQKGRGSATPGRRLKLPKGPQDAEFWATYKNYLGAEIPSTQTFDALIAAYKFSPEFTKRAETTQKDYSRYLEIVSESGASSTSQACDQSMSFSFAMSGLKPRLLRTTYYRCSRR